MDDCIFCKIAKGEIPVKPVYEDQSTIAFHDINPQAPVHILVVPKKHLPDLMSIGSDTRELMANCLEAVARTAKAAGVDDSGFRVIINQGADGGQEVFHLHFHLLAGRKMGPLVVS